jgi:hypothetical protein
MRNGNAALGAAFLMALIATDCASREPLILPLSREHLAAK